MKVRTLERLWWTGIVILFLLLGLIIGQSSAGRFNTKYPAGNCPAGLSTPLWLVPEDEDGLESTDYGRYRI